MCAQPAWPQAYKGIEGRTTWRTELLGEVQLHHE